MKHYILLFSCLLLSTTAFSQVDTAQRVIPGRENSPEQEKKPYVILISADGFRYDVADKFHAKNLIELRSKGVQAEYLQPCYPSLTFPNHYAIVTGLYPEHNGLVANGFLDQEREAEGKLARYGIGDSKAVT